MTALIDSLCSTSMSLLTTKPEDARALGEALQRGDSLIAVCLCADWCDTCRDFQSAFARLAQVDPSSSFVWLDVEDDSALVGDLDIENFPTLAVFRGGQPVFYGVTLPQEGVVARTLAALADEAGKPISAPEQVARLPQALLEHARARVAE